MNYSSISTTFIVEPIINFYVIKERFRSIQRAIYYFILFNREEGDIGL